MQQRNVSKNHGYGNQRKREYFRAYIILCSQMKQARIRDRQYQVSENVIRSKYTQHQFLLDDNRDSQNVMEMLNDMYEIPVGEEVTGAWYVVKD